LSERLYLVLIEWLDAVSWSGWQHGFEPEGYEPATCYTTGWLLHRGEHQVTLAQSLGADGEPGNIWTLPAGMVVSTRLLRTVETDQDFEEAVVANDESADDEPAAA
jgi:hypothetical protein